MTERFARPRAFRRRHPFGVALALIAAVGLAIRVTYSALMTMQKPISGDALFFYYWGAVQLARGHGYLNFSTLYYDYPTPGAHHPPGFTTLLAGLYDLGLHSPNQMRLAMCVMGTITVVLVGHLVRELVSDRAGLIAAALCAIYPNIWISDAILWSETLVIFAFTLALCGIYAFHRKPTLPRVLTVSVGLTIAALTRAEILVLFPLVLVPLVLARRNLAWRRRFACLCCAAVLPLALTAAWTNYNSSRFAKPVMLSTGFGPTALAGACAQVFSGPYIGSKSIPCTNKAYVITKAARQSMYKHGKKRPNWPALRSAHYFAKFGNLPPAYWDTSIPASTKYLDESVDSARARKLWWQYTTKHADQLPRVILAREGRLVGLWNPAQQNDIDRFDGRGPNWLLATSQWMFWALSGFAILGVALWRRRRIPLYPLVVEATLIVAMSALVFGLTRYRAAIEVGVVIWAATAIDWAIERRRDRRRGNDLSASATDAASA